MTIFMGMADCSAPAAPFALAAGRRAESGKMPREWNAESMAADTGICFF